MNTQKPSQLARVFRPHRIQVEMHMLSLEDMLPRDHRARIVWSFVKTLDLEPLYEKIVVTKSTVGRNSIAPEILVSLWLLATLDGIGTARELGRRCETDIAYLWTLGNVTVNYHTLSDFRVENGAFLEKTLVDTVASLVAQGLVPLETIAQDGMRVRASAGSSSFRRKPTLESLQQQAQAHVDRLKKESENECDRSDGDARRQAAVERASRERQERLDEALRQFEELSKQRESRRKGDGEKTRVSTTDPDARNMKMANGGFDPAFNVQFATDADSRVIVAVDVTNSGTDSGQMAPMHEKVCSTYDKTPKTQLVDSAYATKGDVKTVESKGTEVVSTIPRGSVLESKGKDPHAQQPGESDEYTAFRARMAKEEYKELYKTRPSVAEFPNADCRNRNLRQFKVRGLVKVKAVALWHAVAFNFTRMVNLGALAI
ncbi:IS1182 family transposase [Aureliella helgolandensis]|nr:IS1182 family transposase [Aureliella helgolandensis]